MGGVANQETFCEEGMDVFWNHTISHFDWLTYSLYDKFKSIFGTDHKWHGSQRETMQ